MTVIEVGKIFFLFLSCYFVAVNFSLLVRGHEIAITNFFLMSVGLTGFIYLQWIM